MTKTPATTTQGRRPRQATVRTLFQQLVGWIVAAGLVLPLALAVVQEELGDVIPPHVMSWIVVIVGVAVAVSTTVARIMAIPAIETFLRRHALIRGLAADPPARTRWRDRDVTADPIDLED